MQSSIPIALVDDHIMLRKALASLIESFGTYHIVLQASNGKELFDNLPLLEVMPVLVLLDINMPEMNGIETAKKLQEQHPNIKVLALSMMDNETSIIGMIKNGARGYMLKDAEPAQLKEAMDDVVQKGFHYSDIVSGRLFHSLQKEGKNGGGNGNFNQFTDREIQFLRLSATDFTYKEIADKMFLSPRTVDGYREAMFEKLGVKSRVGLAMYAVKMNLLEP